MATVIRLTRRGRRNAPFYRIGVFDVRTRRDGRAIENLGHYNPLAKGDGPQFELNVERAKYWISVGARPSATVASFLKREGVAPVEKAKKTDRNRKRSVKRLAAEKKSGKLHGKTKKKAAASAKASK
ncbi:MAG TPA: 30S ribosomal protein S16 [Planctomycetes bacterium]|nr:30S ribosomal protein S16 [Planctomycetota bacterium]